MRHPYDRLSIDLDAPTPIAGQLASQITWLVASGQIEPDEQLPSIRALAEQLGINMHTVRAAYRQLEASGMAQVRQGRGTRVIAFDRARMARAAPSFPTFTVGVLIPSYSSFYTPFLNAVEASADEEPLMFLVCNTQDNQARVARWLDQLVAKKVDGILIASRGLPERLSIPEQWGFEDGLPPVVFVDIPDSPEPRVLFDHISGGRMVAEHMLEHGFERPVVLAPPLEWSNVFEVYRGFEKAYLAAGNSLAPSQVVQVPDFTTESGRVGAEQLLAAGEPPQAIFAAGDHLALGVQQALRAHDLRAPDDLSLIGYDGIELSRLVEPPLTTVDLDVANMGKVGMRTLRQRMAGLEVPAEVRLPVRLIVGGSCGCRQ